MMKYKVSVIIPIYGVENFIARCVESLMEQTLQEIEYIFVNDATPDGSMKVLREVLSRYPNRSQSVNIVEHEANKGLPVSIFSTAIVIISWRKICWKRYIQWQ